MHLSVDQLIPLLGTYIPNDTKIYAYEVIFVLFVLQNIGDTVNFL